MSYHYLVDIALILISTKLLGMVTKRFQMPQVVGALLAGLIMGPAFLNIIHSTEFLTQVSELGVIVMMFTAGLGTSLEDLKQTGKAGFCVALCGVIVPWIGGSVLAFFFNDSGAQNVLMQNVFIGVILTATSVSITVEALKEMGKLSTVVGNTILAAALIDDILGLIALTIVTSLGGSSDTSLPVVLLKIVGFFIFVIVVGVLVKKGMDWYVKNVHSTDLQRYPIFAFVLCLFMAYCAEEFFGVADITGSFAAGLIISTTAKSKYIEVKFAPLSYLLLTPIFFASIGLKVELPEMNNRIIVFSILLALIAVLTKLIGCGLVRTQGPAVSTGRHRHGLPRRGRADRRRQGRRPRPDAGHLFCPGHHHGGGHHHRHPNPAQVCLPRKRRLRGAAGEPTGRPLRGGRTARLHC